MELFVNGDKLDIQLENEKTIGEVLTAFEQECASTGATTVSIRIDGKNITAEEFDKVYKQELTDSTKIELGVVSETAISSVFHDEAAFSKRLSVELKDISVKFQSGKDKEANVLITQLADLIDNICHTASLSALFPQKFGTLKIDDKSFSEFFADFSQIFKDFEQAIESKDTVLMGDLAEYEISPRLESIALALQEA